MARLAEPMRVQIRHRIPPRAISYTPLGLTPKGYATGCVRVMLFLRKQRSTFASVARFAS